jgi:hypothetical protein
VLTFVSLATSVAAQTRVSGTSVALEAPDGFIGANEFSGLVHPSSGSSVVVIEFPAEAYVEIGALFGSLRVAREAFASRGIVVTEHETLIVDGHEVPFLTGHQDAQGQAVGKYIAVIGGERTALVTFNVFDPDALTQEQARQAVRSITFQPPPSHAEQLAELSFTFQAFEPFRVSDVLAGMTVALTTVDEVDPSGRTPVIIIGRGTNLAASTDARQAGLQLLRATVGFESATVTEETTVQFAGQSAHLVRAQAGQQSALQIVLIPEDRRHLRFLALGETGALAALESVILEVADSVALRE